METTIWQTYPQDEVLLLGISNTNNSNIIGNFIEENNLTYPILFDPGSSGGVQGGDTYDIYYLPNDGSPYPRDFIVDQNGIIQYANNEIDMEWMIIVLDNLLYSGEMELEITFFESWNMVGLPLFVSNSEYQFLFPESVENTLFSFSDGGYSQETQLIPGTGYWLRFQSNGIATLSGQSINELTIELSEGWNLISGVSETVNINSIYDPNQLIIEGTIFGFSDGYESVETIEPGNGYWVRSNGNGIIVFQNL